MGEILTLLVGEGFTESFVGSLVRIELMYWWVADSSCDCCLAALISAWRYISIMTSALSYATHIKLFDHLLHGDGLQPESGVSRLLHATGTVHCARPL